MLFISGVRAAETPAWLADAKELLPAVSDATIEEMRSLHAEIREVPEMGPIPESYYKAALRVVELRDQASLAMIHLYVEEVPRLRWNDPPATRRPAEILRGVFLTDTVATQWVLPLLRHRLGWIESSLRSGRLDESGLFPEEMGAIEGYMNIRGTSEDLMRVHDLMREIAQSKTRFAKNMLYVPTESEDEKKANEHRRTSRQRHLKPYYMSFLPVLEERERELKRKGIASEITTKLDALRSGKSPESKSTPTTSSPSEKPTSSTPWSIIVVLIVAALGLLWLVLKNRK
jgi:hypothetical protein